MQILMDDGGGHRLIWVLILWIGWRNCENAYGISVDVQSGHLSLQNYVVRLFCRGGLVHGSI